MKGAVLKHFTKIIKKFMSVNHFLNIEYASLHPPPHKRQCLQQFKTRFQL
jgi:hypothetical protein